MHSVTMIVNMGSDWRVKGEIFILQKVEQSDPDTRQIPQNQVRTGWYRLCLNKVFPSIINNYLLYFYIILVASTLNLNQTRRKDT